MVGRRAIHVDPVPESVRTHYLRQLRNLWNLKPTLDGDGRIVPQLVTLTPDARDRLDAFRTTLEPRLANDGDLGAIPDWGGKLAGAVVRIAASLHLADLATSPAEVAPIPLPVIERALTLGDYFTTHALVAFRAMRQDAVADDAAHVMAWLRRRDPAPTFSKRDVQAGNRSRFPVADDVEPVLAFLVKTGWIRPVAREKRVGRPSELYEVHPKVRA
jgi:hypothetical protein